MSEIRTKVLALSALAMAFSALSYGQTIACTNGGTLNPTIRVEGETELVGDAMLSCTTTGVNTTGTVTATLSATVTSKAETTGTAWAGNSDAIAQVNGIDYPGTVAGTTITFANVAFPTGAFTVQISNVRVNASAASNPQITESVQVVYQSTASVNGQPLVATTTAQPVGYATTSLTTAIKQGSSIGSFQTCAGLPLSQSGTAPALTAVFQVSITEGFANAFKAIGAEQGSFQAPLAPAAYVANTTAPTGVGTATQATELQVALTGVPSAATIYLPVAITMGGTTLTLSGSPTALATPNALAAIAGGVVAFTPSGGAVTAMYIVTANNATPAGTIFPLNVYETVAATAAPVQTTAMTVAVTYAPAAAVTGPQGTIPTFAVSTAAPLNTLTVSACTTTLIFPFVTNATGFETGIAIANTTTDSLGKAGASSVTASPGTCTLNFYGNVATAPAAFTTPSIGVYATSPAQSPVYANTLTSMAVPAFTGYAIASCNFLDAHGFAYIVDNFGQSSGTAEGYLAIEVPSSRASSGDGILTGN